MFGKELYIKKYPYLGFSQNIMEYFSIIGYQENFIPILIDSFKKKKNPYSPTVLSSITSNIDYGIVDNELIISQIYPKSPSIIQINKNDIITQVPPTSNVIYSFCFDALDGKSKIFHTCFGYKFYEKYLMKSTGIEYYIPKAFCIISQMPFFNLFEYICRHIHILMTKKTGNILPVELIVYNIVNYVPTPMNYCIYLDLFSFCIDNAPVIQLHQLSGYPYIDFDLKEIFNILPINFFLEIFLFTIIEQNMLFFCSNLELLNMVMYIMYILNYPCNDSTYFWHIVSLSKENLTEDNKFVGKMMSKLLGINDAYDESINTNAFGRYHFIVDLDNKKMFLKEYDIIDFEKDDINNLNNLQIYIQNILRERNVTSSFLKCFIVKLKKNLENIINKEEEQVPINNRVFKGFFRKINLKNETNKLIQEVFYDFCLNILMIFYQDNTIDISFEKIIKNELNIKEINKIIKDLNINDDINVNMTDEEKAFCDFFRMSVKYTIYFETFIQDSNIMDIFKVGLLFSEELINIKIKDTKNRILNQLSLFKIIDKLYYPEKQVTINITINNFFSFCLNDIKFYFEEYINCKENAKPRFINFNKKIINKYIYLLNNNYERDEIMDLFPSIRIQEEKPIIYFDRRHIMNIIQNTIEPHINTKDFLIYSLVYIFCITMSLHSYNKMVEYLSRIIKSLGKIQFYLRHYGYIILQTFYKYLIMQKEKKDIKDSIKYPEMNYEYIKMYYYMLITFLKQNNVVPNEEMMRIFTNFFGKMKNNNEKEKENAEKEESIDKDINFKIIQNENFFCFMKHCFDYVKYYKSNYMIKAALKHNKNSNIIIKTKKLLNPTITIKIKEYIYSTYFFSPVKIFKVSEMCFNEFNEINKLDFSKIQIDNIRDCIANLIQYGLEIEDIPVNFLINTLYLLRNYEEKYLQKNN